jgi:hypothetical protein
MTRRLLNLLTGLSLLLCVAVVALWVRGGRQMADTFSGTHVTVRSLFGGVVVAWGHGDGVPGYGSDTTAYRVTDPGDAWEGLGALFARSGQDTRWTAAGIHHERRIGSGGTTLLLFTPSWLLALLFGIPPATWGVRRFRRRPPGECKVCGYDVRATPDHCPECGTPARTPPVA